MRNLAHFVFAALLISGCQFNPRLPSGRILCKDDGECPKGHTCEDVAKAAWKGTRICCSQARCTESLSDLDVARINAKVLEIQGTDAGADMRPGTDAAADVASPGDVPSGCSCDPLTNCPTSCPNEACKKRKLVEAGTCQARCADDGMETECVGGDGCCPVTCNATNDSDCRASCGNMTVEPPETCDPGDTCPTACPAIGCTLQTLEGSASACDARCVDAGKQTMCMSGDSCCPMGCTTANDQDCECVCGNSMVEATCGEICDPPGSCPQSCPPMGCQLRRMVNQGTCQAQCVNDGMQARCMNGDGCCPSTCNATNDNDCTARCGNGAVETGETCDPSGSCPRACPWNGCSRRKLEGEADRCTARCVDDGTQTQCAGGDGCCPSGCNSTNDSDCSARCGNGVREGNEKCDGTDCPASCPNQGCQRRRLQGSAAQCTAECVDNGAITTCTNGDGCCANGCTSVNDNDCSARCGNGVREGSEKCDGADCPTSCPAMGCMRRRLVGTAAQCTAECVADGTIMMCVNGDNCCPSSCNRNTDNNCPAVCGNGVIEMGETCDPVSMCMSQSAACVSDRNTIRTGSGMVANCTFRCTQTPRPCNGTSDGQCPSACMPCVATCGTMQDIDCKLPDGSACTHPNQCSSSVCSTYYRDGDGDGFGGSSTSVCGTTPPSGHITTGGDCCDTDVNARPGQLSFFVNTNACGTYDYNCNNVAERRHLIEYECADRCLPGWTTAPAPSCGGRGTYRTCGGGGNGCNGTTTTDFPQSCR